MTVDPTGRPGDDLDDDARAPIDRWHETVSSAAIPASAREFSDDLRDELVDLASRDEPSLEDIAADFRSEEGINRRGRALRILDRLGYVDSALRALSQARDARRS